MPTLTQLTSGNSDPTLVVLANSFPVVEPLDGPTTVDEVFDRFPEEVYQQGKDSHLYRLLSALGGNAGAGFVKQQVYASRLQFEAEFLEAAALDSFYGYQFSFPRLKGETYAGIDPAHALTPPTWDQIELADQAYRHRIAEFWTATRGGTSPEGLTHGAQAGIGVECEIVENYKWVFDQYSDDPLGLAPLGTTTSTAEFVVIPRFKNLANASTYEFTESYPFVYAFTTASLPNARPALGGTPPSVTVTVGSTAETSLLPELERNAIEVLDRLKPVGTVASINPDQTRYIEISAPHLHASSERIHPNRLVQGQANVPWPDLDSSKGYFIQAGVENEATYYKNSARELPVIFLTVENVHAYTDAALGDPAYGSSNFYAGTVEPYTAYKSEHVGFFSAYIQALFPFLNGISQDADYGSKNAVAIHDTPLVLETKLA